MIYSCLSYPGAKRKVINELLEIMPDGITDWREPFFGGGSVSIGFLQSHKAKDCKRFLVGDLYTELWAFWVAIQKDPKQVEQYVWYDEYELYGCEFQGFFLMTQIGERDVLERIHSHYACHHHYVFGVFGISQQGRYVAEKDVA